MKFLLLTSLMFFSFFSVQAQTNSVEVSLNGFECSSHKLLQNNLWKEVYNAASENYLTIDEARVLGAAIFTNDSSHHKYKLDKTWSLDEARSKSCKLFERHLENVKSLLERLKKS